MADEGMKAPLLEVRDLSVSFDTFAGEVQAVRDVSFSVKPGEIVAIVGESGSGKTVMTQSLVKLLPSPPTRLKSGSVSYGGELISAYGFKQLRRIKGREIAYIFQDPMTSLNPTMKVGNQVIESLVQHGGMERSRAKEYAVRLLAEAGIPESARRVNQYPHALSGGMRQRVMIAMAIALKPKLLVADEPTTALDVTIQSQILRTLKNLNRSMGMAIILITHDMGIVANIAARVMVMYGGKIVESAPTIELFEDSMHPYTRSLLASVPRLDMEGKKDLLYIVGSPPDMLNPPEGCPFAPRCRFSMRVCYERFPERQQLGDEHAVYCYLNYPGAEERRAAFLAAFAQASRAGEAAGGKGGQR
jgi:oligopeptide transport system ATP-binding protein